MAEALRVNKHPRAEGLLMKMWNDPDRGVRIAVANRLKDSKSIESLTLLKTMLKDADEFVSNAARESLKARTSP